MSQHILIEIEFPAELEKFRLPEGVNQRLQALLDRQDQGEQLTPAERQEAEGLVDLAELLSLLSCGHAESLRQCPQSMSYICSVRRLVLQRQVVRGVCGLSQAGQAAALHIDHVIPRVHGETVAENLALAVYHHTPKICPVRHDDLSKWRRSGADNPRRDIWHDTSDRQGVYVRG